MKMADRQTCAKKHDGIEINSSIKHSNTWMLVMYNVYTKYKSKSDKNRSFLFAIIHITETYNYWLTATFTIYNGFVTINLRQTNLSLDFLASNQTNLISWDRQFSSKQSVLRAAVDGWWWLLQYNAPSVYLFYF